MSLKRNENYSEWYDDIRIMHDKFGAKEWVRRQFEARNYKLLNDFLAFRLDFLEEEFEETQYQHPSALPPSLNRHWQFVQHLLKFENDKQHS